LLNYYCPELGKKLRMTWMIATVVLAVPALLAALAGWLVN